jgi:hypothetical protein
MPAAEAHVETDRPGRSLTQLCRHSSQMSHLRPSHGGGGAPPRVQQAECSDTNGVITFGEGQCTMRATSAGLLLRVEASDAKALRRIQDGVTSRLEKIGRRDHITVEWASAETNTAPAVRPARTRRGRLQAVVLVVAIVLVVALHLGVGGAVLSDARWTGQATEVLLISIVVMVAVKLLVLRRLGIGHRALRAPSRNNIVEEEHPGQ